MEYFHSVETGIIESFTGLSNLLQDKEADQNTLISSILKYCLAYEIPSQWLLSLIQSTIYIYPSLENKLMMLLKELLKKNNSSDKILPNLSNQLNIMVTKNLITDPHDFGIRPNDAFLNFYQKCIEYQIDSIPNYEEIDLTHYLQKTNHIMNSFGSVKQMMENIQDTKIDINSIEYFLKTDDISTFQSICETGSKDFSPANHFEIPFQCLYTNFFEIRNYLALAAFFGSLKCFKFLLLNYCFDKSDNVIFLSSILGGNNEIIRILYNEKFNIKGSAHIAFIFNRREILDWLTLNCGNDIYLPIDESLKNKNTIKMITHLNCTNSTESIYYDNVIRPSILSILKLTIKQNNLPLFVFYLNLLDNTEQISFINNTMSLYSFHTLELCLLYRSYDVIDHLLGHPNVESDFPLSDVYDTEKFLTFYEQVKCEKQENRAGFVFILKNMSSKFKVPANGKKIFYNNIKHKINGTFINNIISRLKLNNSNPKLELGLTFRQVKSCGKRKPVIYLYPHTEKVLLIKVKVELINDIFHCTFPQINEDGTWIVKAKQDGTLINEKDNRVYQSLFWESITLDNFGEELQKGGKVVSRNDTIDFLEDVLPKLGLNIKEKNEFIQFWLPIMIKNTNNFVRFLTEEEIDAKVSKLEINPKPDTIIRVYMVFQKITEHDALLLSSDENMLQDLSMLFKEREGFTAIEWGGTDL